MPRLEDVVKDKRHLVGKVGHYRNQRLHHFATVRARKIDKDFAHDTAGVVAHVQARVYLGERHDTVGGRKRWQWGKENQAERGAGGRYGIATRKPATSRVVTLPLSGRRKGLLVQTSALLSIGRRTWP